MAFPKGNRKDNTLSLFLVVADDNLPCGWTRHAKFSITVVNQIPGNVSRQQGKCFLAVPRNTCQPVDIGVMIFSGNVRKICFFFFIVFRNSTLV